MGFHIMLRVTLELDIKCRCTKVGALLSTPLLVHGQSEPCAAATRSRAKEGSRREAEAQQKTIKATPRPETQDNKGVGWSPLTRPLPGQASAAPARTLPGQLAQTPTERATLEPTGSNPTNYGWTRAPEAPL